MKKGVVLIGACNINAIEIAIRLAEHNLKDIMVIGDTSVETARIKVHSLTEKRLPIKNIEIPEIWKNSKFFESKSKYHK